MKIFNENNKMCASFLVLLIFVLFFAGCTDKEKINSDETGNMNQTDVENVPEETAKDMAYEYGGERIDFNGETFTILYDPDWSYGRYIYAEEITGNSLNDAIYKRILDTEDFFNIVVKTREVPEVSQYVTAEIGKEVKSGLNTFDIGLMHCITGPDSVVINNYAYNWMKMPNVDFSKKYWNQSVFENYSINGYFPFVVNDFLIPDPCFLTFNKTIMQDYAINENLYELVKKGKWTLDKFIEIAKKVSADLDGDGEFTEKDLYGYSCTFDTRLSNVMYACDQPILKKEEPDGRYTLGIYNEKTQNIVEKFYGLLYTGNQTFIDRVGATWLSYDMFADGQVLFCMQPLVRVKVLLGSDVDFGILPYPKYDEKQEKYLSLNWGGFICAPITISNPEKVGAVVEYLGAKSRETVWPEFYETFMSNKFARDSESIDMLEIIYSDNIYDFGLTYSQYNDFLYLLPRMMEKKTTDLASWYESRANSIQKIYDKYYDAFIESSKVN